MGIQNLHQLLEKYAPECYIQKHLSEYAFKKIGIDISLYLYKFKASRGDDWLEAFVSLVSCLRKWDIHCFFIYDGKAPIEKIEEQKRRRENLSKQGERADALEKEILNFESNGEVGEMIREICKKEGYVSLFRNKERINIELAKNKLESMRGMIISITNDDIQLTKNLFDILKVPYMTAPDEAERFACHLCVNGKLDAILSEDTDILPYGTPLFLTKIDIFNSTVVELEHKKILEILDMTKETFLDLCILCSCDYNHNVAGYGWVKNFDLIREYKTIEKVVERMSALDLESKEKTKKKLLKEKKVDEIIKLNEKLEKVFEPSVLKYERCRELFSCPNNIDFYVKYCGEPDFDELTKFMYINGIRTNQNVLKKTLGLREIIFEST